MKSFAIAVLSSALVTVPAFSQRVGSDLSVAVTSASTAYLAGERASFTVTVRNLGIETAENVTVTGVFETPWIRFVQAPGWDCSFDVQYTCSRLIMPVGVSEIVMTGNLPNQIRAGWVTANISSTSFDPLFTNNTAQVPYHTSAAPATANLSITGPEQESIPIGSKAILRYTVTNHGPDTASDVLVIVGSYNFRGATKERISPEAGWNCEFSDVHAICSLPQLPAGQLSTLTLAIGTPEHASELYGTATVSMGPGNDTNPADSRAYFYLVTGTEGDFEKILFPVALPAAVDVPGDYGSVWATEIRAFAAVPEGGEFSVFPQAWSCQICTCPSPPPTGFPMRTAYLHQISPVYRLNQQPGRLLYTERVIANQVEFNVRLYNRGDLWGTEMPVVREREFRTSETNLLNVSIDNRFRQTLRIYDPDARGDGEVMVRFFRSFAGEAAFQRRMTLEVPSDNSHARETLGLPIQPGYAELNNFAELIGPAAIDNLRIEITPITPGLRFWAFVALTHKETQQVITLTPQ